MDGFFRHTRFCAISCFAAYVSFGTPTVGVEPEGKPALKPAKALDEGFLVGRGRLWVDGDHVRPGDPLTFFFEFEADSGYCRVRYPLAAPNMYQILVFDSAHAYLGQLGPSILPSWGSPVDGAGPDYPEKVLVYCGGAVGIRVSIPTGPKTVIDAGDGRYRPFVTALGPGKYVLQGVFTEQLIGRGSPKRENDRSPPPAEMVRSNWLQVAVAIGGESGTENDRLSNVQTGPLKAFLFAETKRVKMGDEFFLRIRCVNTSKSSTTLFDPLVTTSLSRRTAEVYVHDENGAYLGEYLHRSWGSMRRERPSDWMPVQPGGVFGKRFRVKAGRFPFRSVGKGEEYNTLPGRYDFQAAYLDPENPERILTLSKKVRVEYVADE